MIKITTIKLCLNDFFSRYSLSVSPNWYKVAWAKHQKVKYSTFNTTCFFY